MKKSLRLTALVLALVMCFTVTAMAADPENSKMTISSIDGSATVTFDSSNDEKINVTYESASVQEGQFYLVMVVTKGEDGSYVPTQDTILYINQTTGVKGSTEGTGKIEFNGEDALYPSAIKNSAILIYGANVDGNANSLIAAIIEAKFVLGDVNSDSVVNSKDAVIFNLHLAKITNMEGVALDAADINGDGDVNSKDIVIMNQFLAKIIDVLG